MLLLLLNPPPSHTPDMPSVLNDISDTSHTPDMPSVLNDISDVALVAGMTKISCIRLET